MDNVSNIPVQIAMLTITFSPTDQPSGSVDLRDFAQFLDGVRLTLDGLVQHDLQTGQFDDATLQPRLTIVGTRPGSVICDVVVNLFSDNTINTTVGAAFGIGAGVATTAMVAKATVEAIKDGVLEGVKDSATELVKVSARKLSKEATERTTAVARKLMHAMEVATSSKPVGQQRLPSDLVINMLAGLRKMARVGGKRVYGSEGVSVTSSVTPSESVVFNHDSERNIEALAKEALASQEPIELNGRIEEPSRRRKQFKLFRPEQTRENRFITCYYEPDHESVVSELYGSRQYVKVSGIKRYRVYSHRSKPRMIVEVRSLTRFNPPDLWSEGEPTA